MSQMTENTIERKYEYPLYRNMRIKHTVVDRVRKYGRSGMSFSETLEIILNCFEDVAGPKK